MREDLVSQGGGVVNSALGFVVNRHSDQVAELSEARKNYEALQATAQKAKEAALRLKEGLARQNPNPDPNPNPNSN